MYSTNVYYFTQRQTVVLPFGNSNGRYINMYAKNLRVHKGVSNKLQFQFLNQEQKNVNFSLLTNPVVVFRIINSTGTVELLKKQVSSVFPINGLLEVVLNDDEVQALPPEKLFYTLELTQNGMRSPVYIDNGAGARGTLTVEDSILPSRVPATLITIPSHPILNPLNPSTYYTDTFQTDSKPYTWVQLKYSGFIGEVQVQGTASQTDGTWYDIDTPRVFEDATSESEGFKIDGFHPFLRLKLTSGQGELVKILVR